MFSELKRLQQQPVNLSVWQGPRSSNDTNFYAVRYKDGEMWKQERLTYSNAFSDAYKREFELLNIAYIASNYDMEYSHKLYTEYDYIDVYKKYLLVTLHSRV